MRQKGKNISVRNINKRKIYNLLKYGDMKAIANKLPYHYQSVSRIIRNFEENDLVWKAAIEYLNNLPSVELNKRLAEELSKSEAA